VSREAPLTRKALESTDLRPGVIPCLRCARDFGSWDVRQNRLCRSCREAIGQDPSPETVHALRRPLGRVEG
jgi:hypothetical protein